MSGITSDYQHLQLERREQCATLWLNRPERHNTLHGALIGELQRAIDELSQDQAVRFIVLAGRGASFCAGADLEWMRRQARAGFDDNLQDARELALVLRSLALCPKPTLARVHGAALGGGLGLVGACDIAIASSDARFAATETRLGLMPSTVAPYLIGAIGERAARRYVLTGERFDAAEARRLGLVHEVTEPDALDERLQDFLAALRLGAPQAQGHSKSLLARLGGTQPSLEQLEETARGLASIRAGEEAQEGIEAFYARRKPGWAG